MGWEMAEDILQQLGTVFLGSRLKRLGERMQAGAARVIAEAGLPVQPVHMPLLAALDMQPMSINQLASAIGISQPGVTRAVGQLTRLGLVQLNRSADQRQRVISLTEAGIATAAAARSKVWPQVERAVHMLCDGKPELLLGQIAALERALADAPLDQRAACAMPENLSIREYSDDLAGAFHDINAAWIEELFQLEPTDREVLSNPRAHIIDTGGTILFVEAKGMGIVGTCALQKTGATSFELTKMGVRAPIRGLKAGEFLLDAIIARARQMGADPLYLLTSKRCEAAIHLYTKAGFRHDAEIMAQYGVRYARCDVAMRYAPHGRGAGDAWTQP